MPLFGRIRRHLTTTPMPPTSPASSLSQMQSSAGPTSPAASASPGSSVSLNLSTLLNQLISYWPLNESSGTRFDAHNGNNLTDVNSVGSAAGKISLAADFEVDASQRLSCADNASLSCGDQDFEFSCWIKAESFTDNGCIIAKNVAGSTEYRLYVNTSGVLVWSVYSAAGELSGGGVSSAAALSLGTWYFINVWHDATNNLVGLKVNNGTAVTSDQTGGCYDGAGSFYMGAQDAAIRYDGLVDEVGFWKGRILTAAERTALYNNGNGLAYPFGTGFSAASAAPSSSTSPPVIGPSSATSLPSFPSTSEPFFLIGTNDTIPNYGRLANFGATTSGNWDNTATWGGHPIPTATDVVQIPAGITVTLNVSNAVCKTLAVHGTLFVQRTGTVQLTSTTILLYTDGTFNCGTAADKVTGSATFIFRDAAIDTDFDPQRYGHGIICFGDATFGAAFHVHGNIKTCHLRTTNAPAAGNTSYSLNASPTSWSPGDIVYIPDSRYAITTYSQTEYRVIDNVSGSTVNLTAALTYAHPAMTDEVGTFERGPHVSNLTRNIVFKSESPTGTRAHGIFMGRSDVRIFYSEWLDMARTTHAVLDNTVYSNGNPATGTVTHLGTNQVGKYYIHFHHLYGRFPTIHAYQYECVGNVIRDTRTPTLTLQPEGSVASSITQKWPIAIHDSHYGHTAFNVCIGGSGWGIGTEEGGESFNVIEDNFVSEVSGSLVREDQRQGNSGFGLQFQNEWGHNGSGYWFSGQNNYVRRNIAANSSFVGFSNFNNFHSPSNHVEVPDFQGANTHTDATEYVVQAIPILEFVDNECYGVGISSGFAPWFIGAYGEDDFNLDATLSLFDRCVCWNHFNLAFFMYPSYKVTIRDCIIRGGFPFAGISVHGIPTVDYTQADFRIENPDIRKCDIGIGFPSKYHDPTGPSDPPTHIVGGTLKNKRNIWRCTSFGTSVPFSPRNVVITNTVCYNMDALFGAGQTTDIENEWNTTRGNLNPVMEDTLDLVNVTLGGGVVSGRVYFDAQAPSEICYYSLPLFAPPGTPRSPSTAGLTNQQSFNADGICTCNALTPASAATHARILTGKIVYSSSSSSGP